eukprot:1546448-Rhodomonas_salina.1
MRSLVRAIDLGGIILAVTWAALAVLASPVGPTAPNQNNSTWNCLADDSATSAESRTCFWVSISPADSQKVAHGLCVSFGGALASIDSEAENNFVQTLLPEHVDSAWI